MYARFFKRVLDLFLSFCALVCLSPLLMVLSLVGAVAMKGNPFFTQQRPGLHERIFKLIKFRTMTNEKDKDGNLLPDSVRLNKYGRFLRSTSLDELPELINIFKGDMSIVGPRPLSVKYLPFYTEEERKRHSILPGLTGLAQVNGRNDLSWEDKFRFDLQYAADISFVNDVKIVCLTVKKVFVHEGIGQGSEAPVSLHILRAKMMPNKEDQ